MSGERPGPDLRLVPPALACWGLAWWAVVRSVTAVALAAAGCALVAVAVAVRARVTRAGGRRLPTRGRALGVESSQLVLTAVSGSVVLVATAVGTALNTAGDFPGWVAQRAVIEVRGTVAGDPRLVASEHGERWAVRVRVRRAGARDAIQHVHAQVVVLGDARWRSLSVGMPIRADGRAAPTSPGDDAAALLGALGAPAPDGEARWWWRAAETTRAALRQCLHGLPEEPAGLLPSLVLGDTSTLAPGVEADLRTSGLTHLTAVSGANVAILLGAVVALTSWCGLRRRWRVACCAVTIVGFVILARPEPSVLRAAVMGAVGLAGLLTARRGRGVPMLGSAVIILLVADPHLARGMGFALSVAATAALLLLAPVWADRLCRWLPRPAALALAAPAAAQAACAPLVVLLDPAVSTVAVPANLLADPAVMPATVIGVVAALLAPVWPAGAHAVAAVGCLSTWWIIRVADAFSALPGASLPWMTSAPAVVAALALAAVTIVVVAVTVRVRAVPAGRLLAGMLAVGLALLLLWRWPWWRDLVGLRGPSPPDHWAVSQCDVGQGDALAVRTGARRALVIDTGPESPLVDRCLERLRVARVDLVLLSHHHADHVAGLEGVMRHRSVGAVVTGALAEPRAQAGQVRATAARHGVPVTTASADVAGTLGADGWQVSWFLAVPPVPGGASGAGEDSAVNDASLVAFVTVRSPDGARLTLVALGDLETGGQHWLATALDGDLGRSLGATMPRSGPVDLVKVSHHGSAKQDPELYRRLAPRIAVIGVGADNDHGHPTSRALALLDRLGARVFRSDLDHQVTVSARPANPGAAGGFSVLTVTRG